MPEGAKEAFPTSTHLEEYFLVWTNVMLNQMDMSSRWYVFVYVMGISWKKHFHKLEMIAMKLYDHVRILPELVHVELMYLW